MVTAPARRSLTCRRRDDVAPLNYRLRVGRARADDTAPGLAIANDRRVRGSLHGSELDALDLYRFAIARRSDLRIRLKTNADLDVILLGENGHRHVCGCGFAGANQVERRLQPGHYLLAVRARNGAGGSYVLSRLARTITRSQTLVSRATLAPGGSVRLSLRVTPAVNGRATLLVERFDPLSGWLFDARFHPTVNAGLAVVDFGRPAVVRWRVSGAFDGTRIASASSGGTAFFRVEEPPGD